MTLQLPGYLLVHKDEIGPTFNSCSGLIPSNQPSVENGLSGRWRWVFSPVFQQLFQLLAAHLPISLGHTTVPFEHAIKFVGRQGRKFLPIPTLGRLAGGWDLVHWLKRHVPMSVACGWGLATSPPVIGNDVGWPSPLGKDYKPCIRRQVLGSQGRCPDCGVETKRKRDGEPRSVGGLCPEKLELHPVRIEQFLDAPILHHDHSGWLLCLRRLRGKCLM